MPRGYPKAKRAAVVETEDDGRTLSDYNRCDRENADKIVGRAALVQLGQQYGMIKSQMMAWDMAKLRQQIKHAQTQKVMSEWLEIQASEA